MIRKEALEIVAKTCKNNPIVSANGYISRDLFETYEKPSNFYMIGSMGLSSSIGLGVALKNPKKTIFIYKIMNKMLKNEKIPNNSKKDKIVNLFLNTLKTQKNNRDLFKIYEKEVIKLIQL